MCTDMHIRASMFDAFFIQSCPELYSFGIFIKRIIVPFYISHLLLWRVCFAISLVAISACDDSGVVKIIDTQKGSLYKTLRGRHSNICNSVQFRPRSMWNVASGSLDCSAVLWWVLTYHNRNHERWSDQVNKQNSYGRETGECWHWICKSGGRVCFTVLRQKFAREKWNGRRKWWGPQKCENKCHNLIPAW